MVPKISSTASGKGASFKGAARYYLHDKQAETNERVAWTETLNLATSDPNIAWRIMAATAMSQAELKAEAGIKNTGRKSHLGVFHYSLSWHPEEKGGLDKDEMMRAVLGSLRAIGARDRQAMIVAHEDELHPHVHLIINRVSPEDGRMLPDSNVKLKLSEWAQEYEQERGHIYCEERVLNNAARSRGEFTRAAKDQARNIYEQEAANDNRPDVAKEEQRRKDAALAAQGREQQDRQAKAWADLEARHLLTQNREYYLAERADLLLTQRMEEAAHRAAWRVRQEERRAALDKNRHREDIEQTERVIALVQDCLGRSGCFQFFYDHLRAAGLEPYEYRGRLNGVILEDRKFRFNTLGVDLARLQEVDDRVKELEAIQKAKADRHLEQEQTPEEAHLPDMPDPEAEVLALEVAQAEAEALQQAAETEAQQIAEAQQEAEAAQAQAEAHQQQMQMEQEAARVADLQQIQAHQQATEQERERD